MVIDRFEEPDRPNGLIKLYCTIVVERESQKPIVIGRGGDMIKRIGTAAREDLERFFECKVFLDLHVQVKRVARGRARPRRFGPAEAFLSGGGNFPSLKTEYPQRASKPRSHDRAG